MSIEVRTEVKHSCTWELNAKEIQYIKNFSGGPQLHLLKYLPDAPWQLSFGLLQRGEGESRIDIIKFAIFPILQSDDYMRGTSTEAWTREASIRFILCEMLVGKGGVFSYVKDEEETVFSTLTARNQISVLKGSVPLDDVKRLLAEQDRLIFEVKFATADFCTRLAEPHQQNLLLRYFDSPKVADLVFRFPLPVSAPRYIFASKEYLIETCSYFKTLFDSGFAETTESASLDLASLSEASSHDKSFTYDTTELQTFYEIAPGAVETRPSPSQTLPPAQEAKEDQPRPSKRRRRDAQDAAETEERICFVDITETDYTAYRAMLAYLHTSTVPFTALPSDYSVARQKALNLYEAEESDESFTFSSPQTWFQDQFYGLTLQANWCGIEPCSPHAMYRLADCYGIEDLKELARDRILRSLTVENVAYELFSPLSFDYDEIQQSILDYFNKNWAEVKETTAIDIVLDKFATGDLPQARELIKKVWTRMVPEDTSVVDKS